MKSDFYQRITQQIVDAIEQGAADFKMPWHGGSGIDIPTNALTGRSYRGINVLLLWGEATTQGYRSGQWATYRQWTSVGAQVRKGEHGTTVVLWKPAEQHAEHSETGETRPRWIARAFSVFNADQVEGYAPATVPDLSEAERDAFADAFFQAQPAEIWHGSDAAFFAPATDLVSMPDYSRFTSAAAYYSVLAHELIHWTGAKTRLDRDLAGRFGSEAYAVEELIAELGSAFIMGHLGLAAEPRRDHAAYLASWLKVLGNDPKAIFTAASRAQAAADYLIDAVRQPNSKAETNAATPATLQEAA